MLHQRVSGHIHIGHGSLLAWDLLNYTSIHEKRVVF
jgi:hypothetical protein